MDELIPLVGFVVHDHLVVKSSEVGSAREFAKELMMVLHLAEKVVPALLFPKYLRSSAS